METDQISEAMLNPLLPEYNAIRSVFGKVLEARSIKQRHADCFVLNLLAKKARPLELLSEDCDIYVREVRSWRTPKGSVIANFSAWLCVRAVSLMAAVATSGQRWLRSECLLAKGTVAFVQFSRWNWMERLATTKHISVLPPRTSKSRTCGPTKLFWRYSRVRFTHSMNQIQTNTPSTSGS